MKKLFMAVVALACATLVFSCGSKNTNITKGNESQFDSLSYALGVNLGNGIKQQFREIALNAEVVSDAMEAAFKNKAKQDHEASLEILREYFGQTLNERYEAHNEALKADSTAVFQAFVNESECDAISYAFGVDVANNLSQAPFKLQYYWLLKAFNESWNGEAQLTPEQAVQFLTHYSYVVMPAEAAERSAKWLEKKAKAMGVKKTESGLLYKVVKKGDLSRAAQNDEDVVKVHYVGKLQNGKVFDASRFNKRSKEQQELIRKQRPSLFDEKGNILEEEPIEFPLNRVIPGWTEGMKLVGPGGKIKLYIPAELAYGKRGAGNDIGPNEALEFEVELIDVTPAAKPEVEEAPAIETVEGAAGEVKIEEAVSNKSEK